MQNTFVSAGKNTVLLLWTSCLVQTLSLKKNINKCIEILFTIMLVFLTYSHEPTLHNTINVVAIFGLKTNCQNANISERLKKRWQKYLADWFACKHKTYTEDHVLCSVCMFLKICKLICLEWGSNSRPWDYETHALPTALSRHTIQHCNICCVWRHMIQRYNIWWFWTWSYDFFKLVYIFISRHTKIWSTWNL